MRRFFIWMLSLLAPLAMLAATHEYVNLGLPSGTLWAKTNLGASSQEGYGNYYAWGETTTKSTYSWSNYKYCSGTSSSVLDLGKSICGTSYDAARYLWGTDWQMPSMEQMHELIDECNLQLKTVNGVKGMAFIGPNGNSLFFPIPGYKYDSSFTGKDSETYYWSGTKDLYNLDKTKAIALYIKIGSGAKVDDYKTCQRRTGLPIRPVRSTSGGGTDPTPTPTETLQLVDLGLSVKWANMNVDATASSGKGGYYAWGETATKSKYSWATYKYCSGTAASCQNIGSDISKNATYDKAFKDNSNYSLPTAAQWKELINSCTWTAATVNGVKGYNVKGPSGKTIFLPFAGCSYDGKDYGSGSYAYYWSSNNVSSDVSKAQAAYVKSGTATTVVNNNRRTGCVIRGVEKKSGSTDPTPTETMQLVDLGLSVKWANMNVDATASSGKGGYYAWGETATKSKYSWATYKYCSGTATSCQNIGSDISKNATYDKAFKDNSNYCLPTAAQWKELINSCTWTAATVNGVKGYNVKGPSGKTIFLPFAGCSYDGKDYGSGSYAYYWTSNNVSSDVSKAQAAYVKASTATTVVNNNRRTGCAIRGVEKKSGGTDPTPTGGPTTSTTGFVNMGFASGKLWATANVGASAPEKYGNYYAWGETDTKSTYTWDNYSYYHKTTSAGEEWNSILSDDIGGEYAEVSSGYIEYNGSAISGAWSICIDPAYSDTRFSQNGNTYYSRMPSKADFQELLSNTTRAEATVNGVKGVMFTSKKNGNKIFLPYAGSYYDAKKPSNGTVTYYWSSTDDTNDSKRAWALKVPSADATLIQVQCRTGLPVRPIAYIDEDDTPPAEPYAVVSSDKKTLTFYYDDQKDARSGTKYSLNTGYNNPGWYDPASTITKVVFNSSFANARPTSCNSWFSNMKQLTSISGLNYLNTSEVTIMSGMFASCEQLASIDVSKFNTDKVIDMSGMFAGCRKVTTLNLSKFNTSNVKRMDFMFNVCGELTSLDLGNFNTENVYTFNCMFNSCKKLSNLNVSNFNTSKANNMEQMFMQCAFTTLDLSSFTFPKGAETLLFLGYCTNLKELYLSGTAANLDENACTNVGKNKWCSLYYAVGADLGLQQVSPQTAECLWKGGSFMDDNSLNERPSSFTDLGLPSGNLWCDYNVGALHPFMYDLYYAWGETKIKESYTWDTYKKNPQWDQNYNFGYKYEFADYPIVMYDDDYDWAYLYSVGIPTNSEFKELVNNCTLKEATINNVKGIRLTSKNNGKNIFLPYTGSYYDSSTPESGTATYYWTSTEYNSQKAYAYNLKSGKITSTQCQKRTGLPYRAVARYETCTRDFYWWASNSGNFEVDGIRNIKVQTPNDDAIYTLQGVKVEGNPQPGIYVRNGRKFVVK